MKRRPGEWWDKSWSVVTGCTPAGAGCDHCWARSLVRRFPTAHGGGDEPRPFSQVVCHSERLGEPLRRRKPTVYAVSLLGDMFHEQVPQEFIANVLATAAQCDRHAFVLLTKRYSRAALILPRLPYPNLILMASAWDQPSADAVCAAFSAVPGLRWGLHLEPLLGPVRLRMHAAPRWIVVGGENGPGARNCDPEWLWDMREQCRVSSVPFWFKGYGRAAPSSQWSAGDLEQTREAPWK